MSALFGTATHAARIAPESITERRMKELESVSLKFDPNDPSDEPPPEARPKKVRQQSATLYRQLTEAQMGRAMRVIQLRAQGASYREIKRLLKISPRTIQQIERGDFVTASIRRIDRMIQVRMDDIDRLQKARAEWAGLVESGGL